MMHDTIQPWCNTIHGTVYCFFKQNEIEDKDFEDNDNELFYFAQGPNSNDFDRFVNENVAV